MAPGRAVRSSPESRPNVCSGCSTVRHSWKADILWKVADPRVQLPVGRANVRAVNLHTAVIVTDKPGENLDGCGLSRPVWSY